MGWGLPTRAFRINSASDSRSAYKTNNKQQVGKDARGKVAIKTRDRGKGEKEEEEKEEIGKIY